MDPVTLASGATGAPNKDPTAVELLVGVNKQLQKLAKAAFATLVATNRKIDALVESHDDVVNTLAIDRDGMCEAVKETIVQNLKHPQPQKEDSMAQEKVTGEDVAKLLQQLKDKRAALVMPTGAGIDLPLDLLDADIDLKGIQDDINSTPDEQLHEVKAMLLWRIARVEEIANHATHYKAALDRNVLANQEIDKLKHSRPTAPMTDKDIERVLKVLLAGDTLKDLLKSAEKAASDAVEKAVGSLRTETKPVIDAVEPLKTAAKDIKEALLDLNSVVALQAQVKSLEGELESTRQVAAHQKSLAARAQGLARRAIQTN